MYLQEPEELPDNYVSPNFGGKYFSLSDAKKIGCIREDLEQQRENLSRKEFDILLASLLYSMDKIANTVGHYDAYRKLEACGEPFSVWFGRTGGCGLCI